MSAGSAVGGGLSLDWQWDLLCYCIFGEMVESGGTGCSCMSVLDHSCLPLSVF